MTSQTNVDGASIQSIVPRPLAEQVAEKAKRVFELMESQDGTKAYGSVIGTDILITIERVNAGTERPKWWPDGWEWPPELSNEESLRKSLEPFIDVDDEYRNCKSFEDCCKVLFECNSQMKKFFGKKKDDNTKH